MAREGYAGAGAAIRDMDLRASNAEIRVPMLLIAGADDPATPPAMLEDIRSRVPQAELVVLPRAAHIPAVEQADRVSRYLGAFLDGLTGARASGSGGGVTGTQVAGSGGGVSFNEIH